MTAAFGADCAYCIDGFTPTGVHRLLGELYRPCPHGVPCPCCAGHVIFPAGISNLAALADRLAPHGLTAALCHSCLGIADLIPLDDIPPETP
jgi:hypothetical protein